MNANPSDGCQFNWLDLYWPSSTAIKVYPRFSRILELPCSCPHEVNIGTVFVILQHKLSLELISWVQDQVSWNQLPTRSTFHQINSHQINFPDDQLLTRSIFSMRSASHEINFPGDQLPPDQLFPWDQLPMKSTSHEINFPWDQLLTRSTSPFMNLTYHAFPKFHSLQTVGLVWPCTSKFHVHEFLCTTVIQELT